MEKRKRGRPKKDVTKEAVFVMIMEQDLKDEFQEFCKQLNVPISQRLRELMRKDMKENK
jgi:hypothetical protein